MSSASRRTSARKPGNRPRQAAAPRKSAPRQKAGRQRAAVTGQAAGNSAGATAVRERVSVSDAAKDAAAAAAEPGSPLPRVLLGAAAAVGVLAVVLLAFGVYFVVAGFTGTPRDRSGAESLGALAIVVALGLIVVTRGLARARRWARAPAALIFLLCLPITAYGGLIQSGRAAIGVPVLVLAVVGLVLLFAPASNRALTDAP